MILASGDPVSVGGFEDQAVNAVAFAFEIGEHAAVEFAGAGKFHPHRINKMSVDHDLVVEMRSGREPRLTKIADWLALPHMRPFGRAAGKPGHVVVGRDIAVGVLDLDAAAVA